MTLSEIIMLGRLKGIVKVEEMSSSRLMDDMNLYRVYVYATNKTATFMYSVKDNEPRLLGGRLTYEEPQPDGVQINFHHEHLTIELLEELVNGSF